MDFQRNEDLESYLRQFKPRRPPALHLPRESSMWQRRLAAAAALTIIAGGSVCFIVRHHTSRTAATDSIKNTVATSNVEYHSSPLALLPLTQLALEDSARFDAALTKASPGVLPLLQGQNSTLRVLAKP